MGGIEPNPKQAKLIRTTTGPVLVDAGAGTGKTFTIAHRYLNILETHGADPEDVLLITFTNNAAEEMRERILHLGGIPPHRLREAPISTFHSLCKRVLEREGFDAPTHLGLVEPLAPNFQLIENRVLERELFEGFLRRFRDEHPEHTDRFRALRDPSNLLELIQSLASKGIFPTSEGWYRASGGQLEGDEAAFLERFEHVNGTEGNRQSKLRDDLRRYRDKLVLPSAPGYDELRGPDKQVPETWARQAFDQDRDQLKAFVHDVYLAYLDHSLKRNVLNFPFLLLFTYVLLVEDDRLRERLQVPFVMIDEFQDTSEIQLQLALLFCQEPNLCCVGDWKQSIYSFQYASVDNILTFRERVARYATELNRDRTRVPDPGSLTEDLVEISLDQNYRSTQPILETAEQALFAGGRREEAIDAAAVSDKLVRLESNAKLESSRVEAIQAPDEHAAVLARIQAIVGNEAYALLDEDTSSADEDEPATRVPSYGDIAVLSRTRSFALELQEHARDIGLPMAFEGGVELFDTDPAKLLLAWLRILEDRYSDRGWALVLEQAGYTLDEIDHVLSTRRPPEEMEAFRRELGRLPSTGAQARAVFDRYGLHDGFTEAIVHALRTAYQGTRKTPTELVRYIEDNLSASTTTNVDDHPGGEVVTVQTIHSAKGLEYPIVIVADLNQSRFPASGGGPDPVITFDEVAGLRQAKVYAEPEDRPPYVYDDWHQVVCRTVLPSTDYDEERRLFYVAMSRAEQHLILSGSTQRPSLFLENIGVQPEVVEDEPTQVHLTSEDRPDPLVLELPEPSGPRRLTVGRLVGEVETEGGRGLAYGQRVHAFAARHARGEPVEPASKDERNVAAFLDQLEGVLAAEIPCALPLDVNGDRFVIEGKLDLLCVGDDDVHVVDWKTVGEDVGLETYARQVGIYAHVVQKAHPAKRVRGWVHYTEPGTAREVEPLDDEAIRALVEAQQGPEIGARETGEIASMEADLEVVPTEDAETEKPQPGAPPG